jgi:hypothetical protein
MQGKMGFFGSAITAATVLHFGFFPKFKMSHDIFPAAENAVQAEKLGKYGERTHWSYTRPNGSYSKGFAELVRPTFRNAAGNVCGYYRITQTDYAFEVFGIVFGPAPSTTTYSICLNRPQPRPPTIYPSNWVVPRR